MPSTPMSRVCPNEEGKHLALVMFINNLLIFALTIVLMICHDWSNVFMTMIGVMTGFCALQERPSVIFIDKILSYTLICGFLAGCELVHYIMLFVNPGLFHYGEDSKKLLIATYIFNTLIFITLIIGTVVSYMLYNNLRKNYQMAGASTDNMFPDLFGSSFTSQLTSPSIQGEAGRQNQPNPNPNFTPFSGAGQKLGAIDSV